MNAILNRDMSGKRTNNDRRNARPRSETVVCPRWTVLRGARGRHVIVMPAILVVGNDNCAIGPVGTVLHGGDKAGDMLLAFQQARITRMLVINSQRLDKRYSRQRAALQIAEEFRFIFQMKRAISCAFGVRGE